MPRVSVVIPTYNCVRYLPLAVESVLRQTYRDFEIVIVDDGSTEDVPAVLRRFDGRVRLIRQENLGSSVARNRGVAASSGDLIAFIDDDDEWMPDKLALQVPAFDDPAVGLSYTDFSVLHDDGSRIESFLADRPLAASGDIFSAFLSSCFVMTPGVVLRRSAFARAGGFDPEMIALQDFDLWFRVLRHHRAALVDRPLFLRRMRAGNSTSNRDEASFYYVRLFEKVMREIPLSSRERRIARRRLADACFERGYLLARAGRKKEAAAALRQSLNHNVLDPRPWRCMARLALSALGMSPAREARQISD